MQLRTIRGIAPGTRECNMGLAASMLPMQAPKPSSVATTRPEFLTTNECRPLVR